MIGCLWVYLDLHYYNDGIYSHVTGRFDGGHCVEVIGYDDNQSCWICKNSWGAGFGENGFFRIAYNDTDCGMDTQFPFWGLLVSRVARMVSSSKPIQIFNFHFHM